MCCTKPLMETQYNRRHGTRRRDFEIRAQVFVLSQQEDWIKWIPEVVMRHPGRVIYEIRIGTQLWIHHANQLRPRYLENTVTSSTKGLDFTEILDKGKPRDFAWQCTQLLKSEEMKHRGKQKGKVDLFSHSKWTLKGRATHPSGN